MKAKSRAHRATGVILATIVLGSSFIGCPLLKKKQTEDDDLVVADAATVSVSGTGAKNEANVLRYANETPINNEPAIIGKDGAKARNFPGNGPEVATLPKGTVVAKIASYFSTGVLIMFDDPIGDGSKLIGWVSPKAFDVAAPAPTKTIWVPPKDAGAKPVVDAGTSVVDAGGGAVKDGGAAPVDAGGGGNTIPQPSKGQLAVPPVDGKCPAASDDAKLGWTIADKMCRRKCNADTDCPRAIKCKSHVCTSGL